jgi:hypothetical protein
VWFELFVVDVQVREPLAGVTRYVEASGEGNARKLALQIVGVLNAVLRIM